MSTELDIRAQVFGTNIMMVAQQEMSKFYGKVYLKPDVTGKTFFQDRIGKWEMQAKGGLNVATPGNDPGFSRRMAFIETKHDNRLLDRSIDLQILADPKAPMTQSAGGSIGREIDSKIIAQMLGNANYGESGASTVALPSGQKIANGGTSLTFVKIREASKILNDGDVEMEGRCFATSTSGLENLLGIEQATSSDYNSVKALMNAEINAWMGFQWIISTQLPVASSIRSCIAFQKYGLCYGMTENPFVTTDVRKDLSYSTQVYYEINHGGVRLEEERIVQVDIDETATA